MSHKPAPQTRRTLVVATTSRLKRLRRATLWQIPQGAHPMVVVVRPLACRELAGQSIEEDTGSKQEKEEDCHHVRQTTG